MPPKRPIPDEDDPSDEEVREGRGTTLADRGTHRFGRVPPRSSRRRSAAAQPRKAPRKPTLAPIGLKFDGSWLTIKRGDQRQALATFAATSGLPPGAPHLRELIAKGRKDLDIGTDYRHPRYQSVADAGPIPEGSHTLPLVKGMPFQKTARDGAGWGLGGWRLEPGWGRRIGGIAAKTTEWTSPLLSLLLSGKLRAYDRGGFFLHHDGGAPGTAGCIGIKGPDDFKRLKQILVEAEAQGQHSATVEVEYK